MNTSEISGNQFFLNEPAVEELEGYVSDFTTYLTDIGIPKDQIHDWKVIFMEASAHAVKHGKPPVKIRYYCDKERVFLEITHTGTRPEKLENITFKPDTKSTSSRKPLFIKEFADIWEHWQSDNGYKQIIGKNHNSPGLSINTALIESSLEELSLAYESLTAFYKLGRSLLYSNNAGQFISESIASLTSIIPSDDVKISLCKSLEPSIVEQVESLNHFSNTIPCTKEEITWENTEEAPNIKGLKEFKCGTIVPMVTDSSCLGNVTLCRKSNDPYLNARELSTIRTFADLFGIAIAQANNAIIRERNQKSIKEIEIAAQLQQKLLPVPELHEDTPFELFAARTSARKASGDYIDAHLTETGDVFLICADVMGKGLPAALLGAMIKTAFSINVGRNPSLSKLIHNLNKIVCDQTSNAHIFATCAIAFIQNNSNNLHIVNAGHCPPLLFENNKLIKEFKSSGPPLGISPDSTYSISSFPIHKDNILLMFTDGLYEWQKNDKIWGLETFLDWLPMYISDGQRMWANLQHAIQAESDCDGLDDDQALLHFKLK